tara:strand:- start:5750 stop:7591 length:1842 start_codon:yes stop_codon:yes gene_type:complete
MIPFRSVFVFLFDLACVVIAWTGAFFIRFNFDWPYGYEQSLWFGLAPLLITQLLACHWAGLYRGMWIFASLPDLRRVIKAVGVSSLMLLLVATLSSPAYNIPRSIVLLYPILLFLLMSGGRLTWRMWKEHFLYKEGRNTGKPIIVIGAGTAGAMLVRELERSPDWRVVAMVDDDPSKWGLELSGRRVEGDIDKLPELLQRWQTKYAIVAMPSAPTEKLQHISDIVGKCGAHLFTVPALSALMTGRVSINAIRPVEIDDLLGRESVNIDDKNVTALLTNKRLLVTGAGGSIGSELCRQLARFNPASIILIESSEYALYNIEQWFRLNEASIPIVPLTGDVKDVTRMQAIFNNWKPHIIFHAAAYKHVPLMEVDNAWQAVRNNVFGTLTVAKCAQAAQAERFVLISTDKAVNPTNVMGATKRLAEVICQVLQARSNTTCFQMVRFGNVLGSTGSVIPKFQSQIARGGPLTVTHPDITRYFMSIPEAAQLVIQAATMGIGGEVFVLDMGKPIKILELARNMIRLSGYAEDEIRIEFTGLRPGEKLYEELLADNEQTIETPHEKLRIARCSSIGENTFSEIESWLENNKNLSDQDVRIALKKWIPEYMPPGTPPNDI